MAVIEKRIRLKGSKGEAAIFDSRSTYSCIKPALAQKLGMVEPLPKPMDFGTAKEGAILQKWRLKLDFEHDEVIIDPRVTKLRFL